MFHQTDVIEKDDSRKICRIIETHSPLSALIAENTFLKNKDGSRK